MDNMIGQRIKERRKLLNITGAQIKEITGISTGNLSSIENGKVLPSSAALIELSKMLECSTDYILFGETPKSEFSTSFILEDNEKKLLNQFRELSVDDQEEIMMMVQLKYNRLKKERKEMEISSHSGNDNITSDIA